jgi:hypothetical protein
VQKEVRFLVRQRVRNFWAGANPAQKVTLIAGVTTLIAVLQLDVTSAPPAEFKCTNPKFAHTIALADDNADTPEKLARLYCTGDMRAATEALAVVTRYTTGTIFHGAIVRLPNSK